MRFGIMEMQLDRLLPADLTGSDAIDQILRFDRNQLVENLTREGFTTIELGGDLGLFFSTAYETTNIQRLIKIKEKQGLNFTLHLPLWSVEPSTPLEPVRLGSVDAILDVMEAVEPLDPEIYVLHATGSLAAEFYRMHLPHTAKSLALKQFQGGAIRSIQTMLEESGIPSRMLAIETIEFPLDLTLEIADLLDLSICFDTGHVLAGFSGETPFMDALEACLPRLAEVHLHDAPDFSITRTLGYGQDHQALGKGDLNIKKFFKRLEQSQFNGPIIFELPVKDAKSSLTYLLQFGIGS